MYHAKSLHKFDIQGYLDKEKKALSACMKNYLTKKSDALTPKICISGLTAKDCANLNFVKNSEILNKLFAEFFCYTIPSYHEIRNTIIRAANITKFLIKNEVSKFLLDGKIPTVEFDQWGLKSAETNRGNNS